jgi:hypothetical protein
VLLNVAVAIEPPANQALMQVLKCYHLNGNTDALYFAHVVAA